MSEPVIVSEILSDARMERASEIGRSIHNSVAKSADKVFRMYCKPSEPLDGLSLEEVQKLYFDVGPSEKTATSIPFMDLMVVCQMVEGLYQHRENIQVSTELTEQQVARYLEWIATMPPNR